MAFNRLATVAYFLSFLLLASCHPGRRHCKATPGTKSWPSHSSWERLNHSLSGQLIKTVPPGAVCHPTQPTYDARSCPAVQAGWVLAEWHTEDPVSLQANNWVGDTCLPDPALSCSGKGYPVYVVNATKLEHVKKGVDFARKNNVRLVVKGTGHDYLGRSAAPNSLSIWTHNLRGLKFFDKGKFKPKGCRRNTKIDFHAITVGGGLQMLEINKEAALRNLTIVSGGSGSVGVGGFITGGGHAAFSSTFGLAADNVLEIEVVTPGGRILTANAYQNEDLFWALRGGGGSTFGILTSVTIKAFPSFRMATVSALFATPVELADPYYNALTSILSQSASLTDRGISAYLTIAANVSGAAVGFPGNINGFSSVFFLPFLHADNSTESLLAAVTSLIADAQAGAEPAFLNIVDSASYPDFWHWYEVNNGPLDAGGDFVLGSRLLDGKALTANRTAVREALEGVPGGLLAHLVGGKGVRDAVIPGGGNSVNPAWRRSYIHAVTRSSWAPFDVAEKKKQQNLNTNVYTAALRKLAPDTGSYINEADAYEPNFQKAFWGSNYRRLLRIKRTIDPEDVLWCSPCVGNERWEVVGDGLCRV